MTRADQRLGKIPRFWGVGKSKRQEDLAYEVEKRVVVVMWRQEDGWWMDGCE